jgi:hypothetical protein
MHILGSQWADLSFQESSSFAFGFRVYRIYISSVEQTIIEIDIKLLYDLTFLPIHSPHSAPD